METTFMRRLRQRRRRAFIESYAFPPALKVKLREKLEDDHQVEVALEGLREWYLACLEAPGEMLGMPSRAVDVAWHEMILMTRIYHEFCVRAFGHYLHHSPERLMDEPMDESLARTLAVLESRSVGMAGVPLLFAIDGELGIADGYLWGAEDVDRLRSVETERYISSGGGFVGPGCGSGAGCSSGGGCGGGGCGGGG